MKENYYPELNTPILKTHARNWGERFPCICSILLCRAGGEADIEDIEKESFVQEKDEYDLCFAIEDKNDENNHFKYDKLQYTVMEA